MADLEDDFLRIADVRAKYKNMFGEAAPLDLSTTFSDRPFPSIIDIEEAIRTETPITVDTFTELNDPTVRI